MVSFSQTAPEPRVSSREAFSRFAADLFARGGRELVLIQPPLVPAQLFDPATARRNGYYNFPPTGLLYLAAAMRRRHPEVGVRILDLNHELLRLSHGEDFRYECWRELVAAALEACEAPVVGASYMFGTTKAGFVEVTRFVRERYPRVPILAGGVQATYDFREIMTDGLADFVARKEGEEQLAALFDWRRRPDAAAAPEGGSFILEGEVHEIGLPPEGAAVDWDLTAAYDLIDVAAYHRYGCLGAFSQLVGEDKSFATVLSNRGCRARCVFCSVRNFNGMGVRQRTVQGVIDEVRHLVRERGVDYIDWLDDDLLFNRERALELFKGLAAQVPELEWTASNGLIGVSIDEEVMEWMVRSGLKAFKIGVESGNQKVLHDIKKPTTKPKLLERSNYFKKYPEVFSSPNFIIGFPGETFGQMMDSFNFALKLDMDWSSFYICQPLKGTEMFSAFRALGDLRCDEESYAKTINPGRAVERGEFGHLFAGGDVLKTGWDVFEIPLDAVPGVEQQKEIWFTFNLVVNFLNNKNFQPGGNLGKLLRWLRAIHASYPHDASMAAAVAHALTLMGRPEEAEPMRRRVLEIAEGSAYWRDRMRQFPELLLLAGIGTAPGWFEGVIPASLTERIVHRPGAEG